VATEARRVVSLIRRSLALLPWVVAFVLSIPFYNFGGRLGRQAHSDAVATVLASGFALLAYLGIRYVVLPQRRERIWQLVIVLLLVLFVADAIFTELDFD